MRSRWFQIAVVISGLAGIWPSPARAQCPDGSLPPCRSAARAATPGAARSGVAVLYFENLSRDSTYAYLADGLTEELILRLGNVSQLDVRSRFAVRRYKGLPPTDPAAVGHTLGVNYLVVGSVRPGKDRVRVTVEVVRSTTGARVWGKELDGSSDDLLAVTDEVAQVVAQGIVGQLAPAEAAAIASRATNNPEAYDHFLRGNFAMALRTPQAVLRALNEYQTALRLDPAYTAARARTAYAYSMLIGWGWRHPSLPADSVLARGAAEADRALRQDSASSDAWMARGMLLWFLEPRTMQGSIEALERSVALDPSNAEAWNLLGVAHTMLGEDSAAEVVLRRALAIEPGRPISLMRLAEVKWFEHDYAHAMRLLDTLIAVAPGFYNAYVDRVGLLLHAGDTTAARRESDLCTQLGADDFVTTRTVSAWVQAVEGDSAGARRGMDSVLALTEGPNGVRAPVLPGVVTPFVALGDTAKALAIVERSMPRGPYLWLSLRWPTLEPLFAIPRYRQLMEESRGRPSHGLH